MQSCITHALCPSLRETRSESRWPPCAACSRLSPTLSSASRCIIAWARSGPSCLLLVRKQRVRAATDFRRDSVEVMHML
eukprot:5479782-Alexandrium_andersonii.AAC.1